MTRFGKTCIVHTQIWKDRGIVVLQVSHLWNIPDRFYESPKLKIWMCELCMFYKSGHMYVYIYICVCIVALPRFINNFTIKLDYVYQ